MSTTWQFWFQKNLSITRCQRNRRHFTIYATSREFGNASLIIGHLIRSSFPSLQKVSPSLICRLGLPEIMNGKEAKQSSEALLCESRCGFFYPNSTVLSLICCKQLCYFQIVHTVQASRVNLGLSRAQALYVQKAYFKELIFIISRMQYIQPLCSKRIPVQVPSE